MAGSENKCIEREKNTGDWSVILERKAKNWENKYMAWGKQLQFERRNRINVT